MIRGLWDSIRVKVLTLSLNKKALKCLIRWCTEDTNWSLPLRLLKHSYLPLLDWFILLASRDSTLLLDRNEGLLTGFRPTLCDLRDLGPLFAQSRRMHVALVLIYNTLIIIYMTGVVRLFQIMCHIFYYNFSVNLFIQSTWIRPQKMLPIPSILEVTSLVNHHPVTCIISIDIAMSDS